MAAIVGGHRYSQRYIVAVIFFVIVLAGFTLRAANLGGPDFGIDEVLHVFAARSLMEGNPPLLPSGYVYSRSLLYTYTVALTGKFLGVQEWTLRLPSVIFGCLTITMVFVITRQWYSNFAGLVAAFLTAVVPMQVAFSRQVRMYAMFQFFYIAFVFFFFQALEASHQGNRQNWISGKIRRWCESFEIQPTFLIIAVVLFLLATNVHRLTLTAISGPLSYIVCMAAIAVYSHNIPTPIKWKYMVSALFIVLGILCAWVYLVFSGMIDQYWALVRFAPAWAEDTVQEWKFYIYVLVGLYPVVFGTFVLASVFALISNPKATLYLLLCFSLPFVIHSFLFAWKTQRYIYHVVPVIFIIFGVGFSAVLSYLYDSLITRLGKTVRPVTSRIMAGALIGMAVIFLLGSEPWFTQGIKTHQLNEGNFAGVQHNNWRNAMQFIREHASSSDIVITSCSLLSRYYGRDFPLFFLNNIDLKIILKENLRDRTGRIVEYAGGAQVITDLETLREVVLKYPSGWLVTEYFRFYNPRAVPEDVRRYIEQHLHVEDVASASDMIVWRWRYKQVS